MIPTTHVKGIGTAMAARLAQHGFASAESIAAATNDALTAVPGIAALRAPVLIAAAAEAVAAGPGATTPASGEMPEKDNKPADTAGKTKKKSRKGNGPAAAEKAGKAAKARKAKDSAQAQKAREAAKAKKAKKQAKAKEAARTKDVKEKAKAKVKAKKTKSVKKKTAKNPKAAR